MPTKKKGVKAPIKKVEEKVEEQVEEKEVPKFPYVVKVYGQKIKVVAELANGEVLDEAGCTYKL